MSDTKRGGKPAGYDFGAKYSCDKGYSAGTGKAPKKLASKERRSEATKQIHKEMKNENYD